MSRYMIRKPEFLKGAEQAKFFPNTAIVILISVVVYIAINIAVLIAGVIYGFSAGLYLLMGSNVTAFMQNLTWVILFCMGLVILFTVIHVRSIEKRPLRTIGLVKDKFALMYAAGFGAGSLLLALNIVPAFLALPSAFTGFKPSAFLFLIAFVLQSAGEEFLFRGYMLSALMRRGGAAWAVVASSVVFMLYHIPNPVLALAGIALIGVVLSLFVLRTGSLWGAMGLHAAWNFFLGLFIPGAGLFRTNYNITDIVLPETGMVWLDVLQLAIFLAAIALLLFAGKNKLVVRRPEEQILLDKALKLAKKAVSDKGRLVYARRISELAQGAGGKTAVLLYHALSNGASREYIGQAFGEDMLSAADALAVRYGETPEDYWRRVSQYPAALSVKKAESRLEEIKRPKGPEAWFKEGLTQCPMLRWGITSEYCRHIMQAVDGTVTAEDYITLLDRGICRACPVRRAVQGRGYRQRD